MTCSLIITTYNWPEALELVLLSALNQKELPDEIIIADDGSKDETRNLIQKYAETSIVPIIHSWQQDKGFRLAHSRNRAISKSSSDYIIVVDGDMVLDENFIFDHLSCAQKGVYIQGSRVLLMDGISKTLIKNKKIQKLSLFSKDIKNKLNMIRIPLITKLYCYFENKKLKGIRGCNFSLYKSDIYAVNGFNEEFVTWGKEDSEFVQRLYNSGVKRKNLKFSGTQYHLYHTEGNASNNNITLLNTTINNNIKWCNNGLDKY